MGNHSRLIQVIVWLLAATWYLKASDPVDSSRLPYGGTWEGIVGVTGGIPFRTTVYTNLPSSATAADINTAIANCPSNQVVLLTNGTFTLGANDINFGKNGVTLRGATNSTTGLPNTMLVFNSDRHIYMRTTDTWDFGSEGSFSGVGSVSNGATRGSTSIVLSNTPTGLSVGALAWINAPKNAPTIDGDGWSDMFTTQPFSQVVKVTSVSATTVGFTPAINADYLTNIVVKFAWRAFADQLVLAGVENLIMTNTAQYFADGGVVSPSGADQCWVKNCRLEGIDAPSALNAHIYFYGCYNFEVRDSWIENASSYGSSTYALASLHSSGLLILNNVFTGVPNIYPMMATSGTAFAYNYCFNLPYQSATFLSQMVFHHGSHNHFNLFEGNYIPTHYNDATGSGNFSHSRNSVYLRERMVGWDSNPAPNGKDSNLHAITFENHHDNAVVVGCVMGTDGKQTQYFSNGTSGTPFAIFNFDSTSSNTCFRRWNYNTVDDGVHADESLSGGEAIVTSYLFSSKPAWFGDRPWPWVDPNNFSQSDAPTNFPAGFRYNFGTNPPAAFQGGASGSRTTPLRLKLRAR